MGHACLTACLQNDFAVIQPRHANPQPHMHPLGQGRSTPWTDFLRDTGLHIQWTHKSRSHCQWRVNTSPFLTHWTSGTLSLSLSLQGRRLGVSIDHLIRVGAHTELQYQASPTSTYRPHCEDCGFQYGTFIPQDELKQVKGRGRVGRMGTEHEDERRGSSRGRVVCLEGARAWVGDGDVEGLNLLHERSEGAVASVKVTTTAMRNKKEVQSSRRSQRDGDGGGKKIEVRCRGRFSGRG